jgi:hypothetical protein
MLLRLFVLTRLMLQAAHNRVLFRIGQAMNPFMGHRDSHTAQAPLASLPITRHTCTIDQHNISDDRVIMTITICT